MIDDGQKTRPGWTPDGQEALARHPDIDARIEAAIDRCCKRHIVPLGFTDVEASTFARRGAARLAEKINVLPALIVTGPGATEYLKRLDTGELEDLSAQAMIGAMRIVRADAMRSAWYMMHEWPNHGVGPLPGVDHPFMSMTKAELFAYAKRQTNFDLGEHEQIYPFSTDISSKAVGYGMMVTRGLSDPASWDPKGEHERRTGCAMLIAFAQLHQASDWAARAVAARELNVEDPLAAFLPELE